MHSKKITETTKKLVAGRQYYKCANDPELMIKGLDNYECPLWKITGNKQGSHRDSSSKYGNQLPYFCRSFDESGYEIDHIVKHNLEGANKKSNLHALCKSCYTVKTKRFRSNELDDPDNSESSDSDTDEAIDITVNNEKHDLVEKILKRYIKKTNNSKDHVSIFDLFTYLQTRLDQLPFDVNHFSNYLQTSAEYNINESIITHCVIKLPDLKQIFSKFINDKLILQGNRRIMLEHLLMELEKILELMIL